VNIDDCIEVLQAFKAGKKIQIFFIDVDTEWAWKDKNTPFNFENCKYRIAPDVVYKIEDEGVVYHNALKPMMPSSTCVVTKGYWVEGEL